MESDSGNKDVIPDADELERRAAEKMHGVVYTYKTHYKMGEGYEKVDTTLNYLVAILTAVLAILLILDVGRNNHIIGIAVLTSLLSWSSSVADLGVKSQKHFEAGDGYHSLFEDFRDYVNLELPAENISEKQKMEIYDELTRRRRDLKKHTPRTTNFWFNRVKRSDVLSDIETDEDEMETLLGKISSGGN